MNKKFFRIGVIIIVLIVIGYLVWSNLIISGSSLKAFAWVTTPPGETGDFRLEKVEHPFNFPFIFIGSKCSSWLGFGGFSCAQKSVEVNWILLLLDLIVWLSLFYFIAQYINTALAKVFHKTN